MICYVSQFRDRPADGLAPYSACSWCDELGEATVDAVRPAFTARGTLTCVFVSVYRCRAKVSVVGRVNELGWLTPCSGWLFLFSILVAAALLFLMVFYVRSGTGECVRV